MPNRKRNIAALALTIVSIGFLMPGLLLPILSIKIAAEIPILGEISLHETRQSILGTIRSLFENDNAIVGFLILLFSILVPVVKAFLVIFSVTMKNPSRKSAIQRTLSVIGKWSMADVFIVAIFVAYLSTSSEDAISATIHKGFFYFLTYCILSIIAFQILYIPGKEFEN